AIELAAQKRIALLRIAPDALIGLVGHSVQIGDVRLERRRAVANRRRDELRLDRAHLRKRVGAGAGRAAQARARVADASDGAVDVADEIANAHVVLELIAEIR